MPMLHVLFIDFLYRLRDLHGEHVNRYPSLEFHTFLRTNEVILLHDHPPPPTPVIYVLCLTLIRVLVIRLHPARKGLIKWLNTVKMPIYICSAKFGKNKFKSKKYNPI